MKQKYLMIIMSIVTLVVSSFIVAGSARAMYLSDGATQAASGGGWSLPADMGTCVTGIQADGTLITNTTITNKRDCLAYTFPAYTTQAACSSTSNTESAAHLWTNTCVDATGNGISLKDLDLNATTCTQKGGTYKSACTSNWQYLGKSGNGTDGFCYAKINVTAQYGTQAACVGANSAIIPMNNPWSSGVCSYGFGLNNGLVASAVKNMNGSTTVAANSYIPDLTSAAYNNMGKCLLAGFSWNNYTLYGGTTSTMSSGAGVATVATNVLSGNNNCLRCHSSIAQYNSVAERWKESYLLQGHKNMLRKATANMVWGGPDANGNIALYTAAATGNIDWSVPQASVSGTNYPLLYIFGDWMAPAPAGLDLLVNVGGRVKYNGSSTYSCSACHTTGYSNQTPAYCNGNLSMTSKTACDTWKYPTGMTTAQRSVWTEAGLCSLSSYVNSTDCSAASATWYPTTGLTGVAGAEPNATYPGLNWSSSATASFAPAWDQNGIECTRCHMATWPEVFDSSLNAKSGNGHDFGSVTSTGAAITNLCYGCHQSMAKTTNGSGLDVDLANPTSPALSIAATTHDFSGHPIGNEFLNSPHQRFNGTAVPNALGKYDIAPWTPGTTSSFAATGTFGTQFNDMKCSQSTYYAGGQVHEVKTQSDCTTAGGAWSARTDQGTCTSCHDTHNSIFTNSGKDPIKRECTDCHSAGTNMNKTQAVPVTVFNHPQGGVGSGTPFDTNLGGSSCEVCHMPIASSSGFKMHLWRVNTDPNYSTFPTLTAFNAGQKLANTITENYVAANGSTASYSNAIAMDVDLVCGQCHGGSAGSTAVKNSAPYKSKIELAGYAVNMHDNNPLPRFTWSQSNNNAISFDASNSYCPNGTCTYTWNFGDTSVTGGGTGTGQTVSHTYTGAVAGVNSYNVVLTVNDPYTAASPTTNSVTVNMAPTVAETSFGPTPVSPYMTVNLQDSSTAGSSITVNWGDGSALSTGLAGGLFTHTYTRNNTVTVVHTATVQGISASENLQVTVPAKYTVTGRITNAAGTPLSSVSLTLKLNSVTKGITSTDANGNYTFINVVPGSYNINAAKSGYTFASPADTVVVTTGSLTAVNFSSSN